MNKKIYYFLIIFMLSYVQLSRGMKAPQAAAVEQKKDALAYDTYELTIGVENRVNVVTVSQAIILTSPRLKKMVLLAKESSNKLWLFQDLATLAWTFELIEKILKSKTKAQDIALWSDSQLAGFIQMVDCLEMEELLLLALETYAHKLRSKSQPKAQNRQSTLPSRQLPAALTELAAQTVAENLALFDDVSKLTNPQLFPELCQKKVIKHIPLNKNNFPQIYAWLKKLLERQNPAEKNPELANFSRAQYASLEAIAAALKEKHRTSRAITRELCALDDKQGMVKLALLRCLLRSPEREHSYAKLTRVAWLMALEEKDPIMRDKIFEELAYCLSKNSPPKTAGREHLSSGIPLILFDIGTEPHPLVVIKGRLHFLYHCLQHLLKLRDASFLFTGVGLGLLRFSNFCNSISEDFLLSLIDKIRSTGMEETRLLIELIRVNEALGDFRSNFIGVFSSFTAEDFLGFASFLHLRLFQEPTLTDEQKKALNTQFAQHVLQIMAEGSTDESIGTLCTLLMQGADINTEVTEGNTLAHLAPLAPDARLMRYLTLFCLLGATIDMKRANNKGVTPEWLLQSAGIVSERTVRQDIVFSEILYAFANATNCELLPQQFAPYITWIKGTINTREMLQSGMAAGQQAPNLLFYRTLARRFKRNLFGFKHNQLLFTYIQGYLRSITDLSDIKNRIQSAWRIALKDPHEGRVAQLLESIDTILCHIVRTSSGTFYKGRKIEDTLPVLLCNKQSVKELFYLVRNLRQGKMVMAEALDKMGPIPLLELLQFSECLTTCLHRIEVKEALTEELLEKAPTMSQEEAAVDIFVGLILKGADLNAPDDTGNSFIHYTIMRGNIVLFQALLHWLAPLIEFSKKNKNGDTPLLVAAQHDTEEAPFARMLLRQRLHHTQQLEEKAINKLKHGVLHYLLARKRADDPYYSTLYKGGRLCDCPCKEEKCTNLLNAFKTKL